MASAARTAWQLHNSRTRMAAAWYSHARRAAATPYPHAAAQYSHSIRTQKHAPAHTRRRVFSFVGTVGADSISARGHSRRRTVRRGEGTPPYVRPGGYNHPVWPKA